MTDRYQALRDAIAAAPVNQSLTTPSLMQVRHLWDESTTHCSGDGLEAMQHFAQAVLARYGSPQPPARVIADPDTIRALLDERDALRDALKLVVRAQESNVTTQEWADAMLRAHATIERAEGRA